MASKHIRVPADQILVNDKWRGTKLGSELCQKYGGIFTNEIGLADFCPADKIAVMYLTIEDYKLKDYKRKIKTFYDEFKKKTTVLAERNTDTIDDYNTVQDFSTFSLNLSVTPVSGPHEVPDVLRDLSYNEQNSPHNPFKQRTTDETADLSSIQSGLLNLIPGLGRKKSLDLLAKFGHIEAVSSASQDELSEIVGPVSAKAVRDFFTAGDVINN